MRLPSRLFESTLTALLVATVLFVTRRDAPPIQVLHDPTVVNRLVTLSADLARVQAELTARETAAASPAPLIFAARDPFEPLVVMVPTQGDDEELVGDPLTPAQPLVHVEVVRPKSPGTIIIAGVPVPTTGLDGAQLELLEGVARIEAYPTEYIAGTRYVRVGDRRYRDDCSNVLRIPYDAMDVDLFSEQVRLPDANGVKLIRHKSTAAVSKPRVGDLIIFDNTYDRNSNDVLDDLDTHAAIVVAVADDGTVALYNRVRSGHKVYQMNTSQAGLRKDAAGQRLNHVLRRRRADDPKTTPVTTGQLFARYVRVLAPTKIELSRL